MDKIPFDFSLGIDLKDLKGILVVYDNDDNALGYIATYDGYYTWQDSLEFQTPYEYNEQPIEYDNVIALLSDMGIEKGYIHILKFK